MNNPKKLKIANYGLTIGQATAGGDVLILGLSDANLRAANSYFPHLPPETDLLRAIPLYNLFFYKIENFDGQSYPNRQLLECEIGIGELVSENKQTFLKRHYPQKRYTDLDGWTTLIRPFNFTLDTQLIITTRPPETLSDLFSIGESVVCSLGGGIPEIVPINENEILGKIDGDLRSVNIADVLRTSTNPLSIPTDRIELGGKNSTVYSNAISLKSQRSRPENPAAGTIIYNSRKKAFEGYDGENWRTLKWE